MRAPLPVPSNPVRSTSAVKTAVPSADLEKQLAPLRALSRELVGHGMPASLVSELIAEIVAEYGNQVLESEQDARWALVEQILMRVSGDPLIPASGPVVGSYVVGGPTGSGRGVLVAAIALAAAKRGQTDIMLVNTEIDRIGAAAQMDALAKVFSCRVAHAYSSEELRDLHNACGSRTLMLAQASGWSPTAASDVHNSALTWPLHGARKVLCVPATGQCDDLLEFLTVARQSVKNPMAVLSRTDETRNVLPSIGALASARQPVGMIVRGQSLLQSTAAPSIATVVRTALGVKASARKRV
jgi:flagellar biosynthesis GTPase FlhF